MWTIVAAGGSGARLGRAKQYELIGEQRVMDIAVSVAERCSDGVVLVVPASDVDRERARAGESRVVVVAGGPSRSASVQAGLAAVPEDAAIVCVHDAARPFATEELFRRVADAVREGADGSVPGVPLTDTVKRVDADRTVVETPERARLVAVQTPQAFRAALLRSAYATGAEGTDDAAVVELSGGRVVVVDGEEHNRKITHAQDLEWARAHSTQSPAVAAGGP
jgi:2-C-methyl-D-erythritol 4-phosphate cytidylyltransferase